MDLEFPVYRKYPNEKSFFKIIDESHFIEIKLTGKQPEVHHFEAKILPDRNFIQDMLNMHGGYWVICTSEEFESRL
ncbi:MAG: hypothetical protein WEC59_01735 [Salibacteraceae bacterium]